MMGVEYPMGTAGGPTGSMYRTVQRDVHDLVHTGNYRVTPDICRGLQDVRAGVDHIKLDQDFLKSSKEWASKFDPHRCAQGQKGIGGCLFSC